jgi:DNA primase
MKDDAEVLSIDGREVRVTHPDKPYFSKQIKLSKLDLARYYLSVAPGALAGMRDRPLVLKRFVDGADGEAFFQKRAPGGGPRGYGRLLYHSPQDAKRRKLSSMTQRGSRGS